MRLVTLSHAAAQYGGLSVLHHVDFHIDRGEIVTVVGPNGSGKTTLMKLILGAVRPTSGAVTQMPGLRIGYVPQSLHIEPSLPLSVARFLALPYPATRAETLAALRRTGAEGLENRQMTALSGGQFQRVLLARALLGDPDLLILDEATRGLDQPGSAAFYRLVAELRAELGCAVLMVSHELHVVMAASDRVICLNGHVCCEGAPEHVAQAEEYRALFGTGTKGALALYRHTHNHDHDHDAAAPHLHGADHEPANP